MMIERLIDKEDVEEAIEVEEDSEEEAETIGEEERVEDLALVVVVAAVEEIDNQVLVDLDGEIIVRGLEEDK